MKLNSKTIKFISTLLIIAVLVPNILFLKPSKVEAFWFATWLTDASTTVTAGASTAGTAASTASLGIQVKNVLKEVVRQTLMTIARRALQGITKSTTTWINTGYWGNPLFLENPKSFFKDIGKYEVRTLVDEIGYNSISMPFGKSTALNIIGSYKRQFSDNATYTMSKVIDDPVLLKNFRNDFNVGGWNGFLINTQYPQNNYLGYQMMISDELSRRLEGTVANNAQTVQKTLDQGMGYLSPQTCATNPAYNSFKNQFNAPTFDKSKFSIEYYKSHPSPTSQTAEEAAQWEADYQKALTNAEVSWGTTNACPNRGDGSSGLISTTPGSTVGAAINKALGGTQDQTTLAAAMGNSVSAILDALLNKFMQKGLNKLASKVNPPKTDDWSYNGETLGVTPTNDDWSNGPEVEIDLNIFKNKIDEDIKNTTKEITLMDNYAAVDAQGNIKLSDAGIMQILEASWPKVRELDICTPGPDLGWEARMDKETQRNSGLMSEKVNDENQERAAEAQLALNELQFAVNEFKDWIMNKMMIELPTSMNYLDAIDELSNLPQQANQLRDAKRVKSQALARLKSIQIGLAAINTQPTPGSSGEKVLIALKKQYDANLDGISNFVTLDNTANDLNITKDRLANLDKLINQCNVERNAIGGSYTNDPNGRNRMYKTVQEQFYFCDTPIWQGYTHNMFHAYDWQKGKNGSMVPPLPMVNARNVLQWDKWLWGTGSKHVDVDLNCDIIFNSTPLDYKGTIPGMTTVTQPPIEITSLSRDATPTSGGGGGGRCADPGNTNANYAGELQGAIDNVLNSNPVLADTINDAGPAGQFIDLVAAELGNFGLNGSGNILNGNGNPSKSNIIGVWRSGDSLMERYEIVNHVGDGVETIRQTAQSDDFSGDIPLNCIP